MTTQTVAAARDSFVEPLMGFRVDRASRWPILTFATLAFLIIGLGAVAALGVALTRAPAIHWLDPATYYQWLTFHGVLMLTMWPHLFESALWLFTASVVLRSKVHPVWLAWLGFLVIAAGAVLILVTIWTGQASVMYTTYVPLRAYPTFYVGHVLYAVGLVCILLTFLLSIVNARLKGTFTGSLPLVTYGMAVAAIICVVAIISAVVAFVPAMFWSMGILVNQLDPLVFKAAFWGMGHTLQYTNVVSMVVAWYAIASFALQAKPVSEKWSRYAFAIYTVTTVPVFAHHLLVDPTWTPWFKWLGATFVGIVLGIPSIMHGIAVPASVEKKLRENGATGLFGFLGQWGWGNPAMIMLFFSVILFGVGGFDGTAATTAQLNEILHNTMWVPAHIHGTLAGGLAVAFMGASYYLLPALGIKIASQRIGVLQAYLVGFGFAIMIFGMHWAAEQGVPRRTADIAYAGVNAPIPDWFASMNFMAIGGTLAAIGIYLFVGNMLVSVLRGLKVNMAAPEPTPMHTMAGASE